MDVKFKNADLLKQAVVHRSYLNEHPGHPVEHNELLEFLGDRVLKSPSDLRSLESILYPKLLHSQKLFLKRNHLLRKKAAALDIPLLFEFGLDPYCDYVILASTPSFLRKKRVLRRKGMTLKKFQILESEQLGNFHKRQRADFIVPCGREKESSLKKIRKILSHIFQQPMPKWKGKWPSHLKKTPLNKIF